MKTLQQVYDAGLAHIRAQGEPAYNSQKCMYRMPDPTNPERILKCIVGGLFPDEVYEPRFDENGGLAVWLLPEHTLAAIGMDKKDHLNTSFMAEMQSVHDSAAVKRKDPAEFLRSFEHRMRSVAKKFDLIYTRLPK